MREKNIEIFNDTIKLQKENEFLKENIKDSIKNQKIYLEKDDLKSNKGNKSAQIIISKKRTFEAASNYKNKKVCILNFASATNPGGGVTKGSTAQEECLCRCSTLYPCLNTKENWDSFYNKHRKLNNPIYNDDCIYTPDVTVYKTDTFEPKLMNQKDWYKVNVISCAAPNLRLKPSNAMNPNAGDKPAKLTDKELYELHLKRGRKIFEIAKANGNEVLILGAFGCGAFKNPPQIVAKCYKQLIEEYKDSFDVIEFAIYCSQKDSENYKTFERILK